MQTRKNKNKIKNKKPTSPLEHHHLLVRFETGSCPSAADREDVERKLSTLIHDISMNFLAPPHTYYVSEPKWNEGLTAIAPIQTSHIAFHFWKQPVRWILHNPASKCLLQLDIYTCGSLTGPQISRVLKEFSCYQPKHVDMTLINRQMTLYIDRQRRWDARGRKSWDDWRAEIAAER